MKNFNLTLVIFLILGFSCSNNENNQEEYASCINESIDSLDNEFMYKCNTYSTESGRINMNEGSPNGSTSCMLEFISSEYSDFKFQEGDSNINLISIWLKVPSEYYYTEELPEGTYYHSEQTNNSNALRIVTLFRVGPNLNVIDENNSGSLWFDGIVIRQPENYDFAEVVVEKLISDEYLIKYRFETEGKIVVGQFNGSLAFTDNWY